MKVDGKTVASGKTVEFEKNDEDVVITVVPADNYQVKTVKVDGAEVDLDAKNQYTISKIKTLHTVDVVTEAIPEAPMTVTVRYILQGSTAELADSLTEEITADKTYNAATIAGYTATEATKTVTFAAGKSQTVTFFYTKDAGDAATHNVIVNVAGTAAAAVTADGVTDVAENTTATVEIVLDTTTYSDATVEVTVGGVSYGTYTVTGTQSVSVPVGTADVVVNINVTAATPV